MDAELILDGYPIAYAPATSILREFRACRLSPVEYLEFLIDRRERINPGINAFTETYDAEALQEAHFSHSRYQSGSPLGSLDGIPIAIKDETPVAGKRTTSGSLTLSAQISQEDAVLIRRIRQAGGIIYARTTTPEFCCAPWTHSKLWGVTRNPWSSEFSPGGSSGGAGAALAAGLVPLADGSDIGGSIRIPAAFCGLVGFKPPYGRIPAPGPYNLDPFCHQGPIARTVGDCALLQNVLSGHDSSDPVSLREEVKVDAEPAELRSLRVGINYDLGGFAIDSEIVEAMRAFAGRLRDSGAHLSEFAAPWSFQDVMTATKSHFAGYIGAEMRRHVTEHPNEVMDYIHDFLRFLPEESTPYDGLAAAGKVNAGLASLFKEHDILIVPVMATTGYIAGESYVNRPVTVNGFEYEHPVESWSTVVFNIASRHPVLTYPIGIASNGVPISVQIVAPVFDDLSVFRFTARLEQEADWYRSDGRVPAL